MFGRLSVQTVSKQFTVPIAIAKESLWTKKLSFKHFVAIFVHGIQCVLIAFNMVYCCLIAVKYLNLTFEKLHLQAHDTSTISAKTIWPWHLDYILKASFLLRKTRNTPAYFEKNNNVMLWLF